MNEEYPVSSATYSLLTPQGFNILYTVRGDNGMDMLNKMDAIGPELVKRGYKPQPARLFGGGAPKKEAEVVPDKKCPKCGQNLVYGTTKDGKKFIKCSTQKYDFTSKSSTGCPHFEWC